MKQKQNFVAEYFSFSKRQRRGIFAAIVLIIVFFGIRFSFGYFLKEKTVAVDSAFFNQVASLKSADTISYNNNYSYNRKYQNHYSDDADYNKPYEKKTYNNLHGELFAFDPNTASTDDWKRLGIRDKTIETIQHYLEKGGKFKSAADIKKVYGIFPDQAERLMPYIQIKDAAPSTFSNKTFEKKDFINTAETPARPTFQPKQIDVNTADTTAFISLPFIGSKLASRIVNYREKLGGFYKIEQVGETYGIADSVFQKIKARLVLGNASVRKININTADANALKANPYIRWNLANAIFQYRQQHGAFADVADIKKILLVDPKTFEKISPYLTVQ